jgi:hypothetical protein
MSAFSVQNYRMIKAMCESSNPQFPDRPMYPAWQSVYATASEQLENLLQSQQALPEVAE